MTTIGHNKGPTDGFDKLEQTAGDGRMSDSLSEVLPYVGAGALAVAVMNVLDAPVELTVVAGIAAMAAYAFYQSKKKKKPEETWKQIQNG